jgi:hypothetical protein
MNGAYRKRALPSEGRATIKIGDSIYHAPTTDIEGNQRPFAIDSLPDIGAYESQFPAMAHPIQAFLNNNQTYIHPHSDSININVKMLNPHQQNVRLFARLSTLDDVVWDYAELFDDGKHQDGQPGDDLFGVLFYPPVLERAFKLALDVVYADNQQPLTFSDNKRFTSIGPLTYHDHHIISQDSNRIELELLLRNEGKETAALEVRAKLVPEDSMTVRVIENNQYFGHILAGQTARSYRHYVFETDEGLDMLSCDIQISSDGYHYWISDIPLVLHVDKSSEKLPATFSLYQNYPNPFNPSTTIEFDLPTASQVSLKIYNILGEEVVTLFSDRLTAGSYNYQWDASNMASGVYLYRLFVESLTGEAGDYVETKKMILMR